MRRIACICVLAATLTAACGGRTANPVPEKRAIDASLSCDHLAAEAEVNEARLADLAGEVDAKHERNAGMLLVSPLFLDLSDAEKREADALKARNRHLASELERRECPPKS